MQSTYTQQKSCGPKVLITRPWYLWSFHLLNKCFLHKPTLGQADSKNLPMEEPWWLLLMPTVIYLETEALETALDSGLPDRHSGSSEIGKGSAAWFRDEWSGRSHKSFLLKLFKAFLNFHRTFHASRAQNHYYLPLCLELSVPWKPFKSASWELILRSGRKESRKFWPILLLVTLIHSNEPPTRSKMDLKY